MGQLAQLLGGQSNTHTMASTHDLEAGIHELDEKLESLVTELAEQAKKREEEEKEARRAAFKAEQEREEADAEDDDDGPSLNQILAFLAAIVFGVLFVIGWTVVYNKVLDLEQYNRDQANAELAARLAAPSPHLHAQLNAFSDIASTSGLSNVLSMLSSGMMMLNGMANDPSMLNCASVLAGDAFYATNTTETDVAAVNDMLVQATAGNGTRMVAVPGVGDLVGTPSVGDLESLFAASTNAETPDSTGSLTWVLSNVKKADGNALASTSEFAVVVADDIRFGFVGVVSDPSTADSAEYDVLVVVSHMVDSAMFTKVDPASPTGLPANIVVSGGHFAYNYMVENGKNVVATAGMDKYISSVDVMALRVSPAAYTAMASPHSVDSMMSM